MLSRHFLFHGPGLCERGGGRIAIIFDGCRSFREIVISRSRKMLLPMKLFIIEVPTIKNSAVEARTDKPNKDPRKFAEPIYEIAIPINEIGIDLISSSQVAPWYLFFFLAAVSVQYSKFSLAKYSLLSSCGLFRQPQRVYAKPFGHDLGKSILAAINSIFNLELLQSGLFYSLMVLVCH